MTNSKLARDLRDRLAETRNLLDEAKRNLERKSEDAKTRARRELEDLSAKQDELEIRFRRASEEASDGWDELRKDVGDATANLKDRLQRAASALK